MIVTGTDIANRLNVSRSRVAMWHSRGTGGFPAPIASATVWGPSRPFAPLWDWSEIEAWWATYDPNALRGGKRGNKGHRNAVPPKRKRQMRETKAREVSRKAKIDLRGNMERVNRR